MSKQRGRAGGSSADPGGGSPAQPARRKWIWFRAEAGGRLLARDEFDALEVQGRAGLAKCIERYLAGESRRKDVDSLGDGLFELRYRHMNNHFRILFTLWGPHCVALTAFYKNQQKTPPGDLRRARRRADQWRETFGRKPQV